MKYLKKLRKVNDIIILKQKRKSKILNRVDKRNKNKKYMKKIKMLAVLFLTTSMLIFSSCKKEDKPCNCGIITNDAIEFDSNGTMFYTLTITNDCSNNSGKYYFTYDVWLNAPVGSYFCVTNVSSWMPVGETRIERVENKEIE